MQIFLPYTQINKKTDNVVSKKTSSLNINAIKLRNWPPAPVILEQAPAKILRCAR